MSKPRHLEQAEKMKSQMIKNNQNEIKNEINKFDIADKYLLGNESNEHIITESKILLCDPIVRNSLAIPKSDYEKLDLLIKRCMKKMISSSRMEVIRAAINLLYQQSDDLICDLISSLPVAGKKGNKRK